MVGAVCVTSPSLAFPMKGEGTLEAGTGKTNIMHIQIFNTHVDWLDLAALIYFLACWKGYTYFAERDRKLGQNLLHMTNEYRMNWMHQMLKRDTRTMDSIMIGNLSRSITFFANTTIFILLGLVTMLGYRDQVAGIFNDIPFAAPSAGLIWEVKIFLLIFIFIYAFFKYTWSLRQYNYAGIFMVACPAHNDRVEEHDALAKRGAGLVANAAKHFNLGLRAYYFGLAVLAWFIHPYAFILATSWVIYVTYRREYRSNTLAYLR